MNKTINLTPVYFMYNALQFFHHRVSLSRGRRCYTLLEAPENRTPPVEKIKSRLIFPLPISLNASNFPRKWESVIALYVARILRGNDGSTSSVPFRESRIFHPDDFAASVFCTCCPPRLRLPPSPPPLLPHPLCRSCDDVFPDGPQGRREVVFSLAPLEQP